MSHEKAEARLASEPNEQDRSVTEVSSKPESQPEPTSFASRAWRHMQEPVRASGFAEFELLFLTFCTGIQDAISFPDYHCFASNQTGNTVFLMLAIVLPELNGNMFITPNIGAALGFFLCAGWITGQISHIVGPRRRIWLVCSNFIQSCLVFAAAAIQYRYGTGLHGSTAVIVVALLAFAAGSQVVQSRSLKMTEISTAMATAAWVDLVVDPALFKRKNHPRTRRVMFLLSLIAGSLVGAGIYRTAGSAAAIFVSAVGKSIVTIMYFFNSTDKPRKDEGGDSC
ncbi:Uu.00g039780.m01.CDS01 [Anthostomella pinea]|uniref:Uu.00g039780.m01.CDS01 n=1 Tax=Anthostomella pinea TaxID=933095 RepID=A0AAI8VA30_9PEZI|nr:Uu.00g039780.m01.CDS01 [Anthostomella pinea]